MLRTIAGKIFGTSQSRAVARYRSVVSAINALEATVEQYSDAQLIEAAARVRTQAGEGVAAEKLVIECFALVREAAKRALGQRHFDVQLIGGLVLNDGKVAEMKTGEGKTLVATLPATFNALLGHPVHIVTVNDYLAQRDANWMGNIYRALGLSVGCIHHGLGDDERREQYACDVTFATNNELGFDYLRDNMKANLAEMVQRGHGFAVVDEVDSILIDEARTPLIISGQVSDMSSLYVGVNRLMPRLQDEHFEVDEKVKAAHFTEAGNILMEDLLREAGILAEGGLFDAANSSILHHCNSALRAHKLFVRDKDYIVKDGSIVIIDEFTGRMMPGRRYAEGLHQALEAKEGVAIQPENQTLASITFQNYFRLYGKLSGMTGTALTEAEEFEEIYKLSVVEVPTNVVVQRRDEDDEVYRTAEEKFAAVVELIIDCHQRGQPCLVGTTSIEKSESLSHLLGERKVAHQVLNARFHEKEAQIIAQAGMPGAITIATNMAGRGTDIQLGGNADMRIMEECGNLPQGEERAARTAAIEQNILEQREKVLAAGGLYVVGTERHESRRIDNQLRGRSGRQGDPGISRFFLSLEDDLMRIFGSGKLDAMLGKLGLEHGEAIVHPWVTKALETAQKKVEAHHFNARKNILKYDDVMNHQRSAIFEQRLEYMRSDDLSQTVRDMREGVIDDYVDDAIPPDAYPQAWKTTQLGEALATLLGLRLPIEQWAGEEGVDGNTIRERAQTAARLYMEQKERTVGGELFRKMEKIAVLQALDTLWREHLQFMEHLRQVIGLRGYGQRDPLNEYKIESYDEFESLLSRLREKVVQTLARAQFTFPAAAGAPAHDEDSSVADMAPPKAQMMPLSQYRQQTSSRAENELGDPELPPADGGASAPPAKASNGSGRASKNGKAGGRKKIARNSPCPCGSGRKYKNCCG